MSKARYGKRKLFFPFPNPRPLHSGKVGPPQKILAIPHILWQFKGFQIPKALHLITMRHGYAQTLKPSKKQEKGSDGAALWLSRC